MADPIVEATEEVVAPVAGTPEHDAAMIALADSRAGIEPEAKEEAAAPEAKEVPEGVPEKFFNKETGVVDYAGMAKETAYWRDKASGKEAKPEDGPKEEAPEGEAAAKETLESKGLSMDSFTEEFQETGELSEASYKSLEDVGIDKETTDNYIEGQQAIATLQRQSVLKAVGIDEAGFEAMATWMPNNLSEAELASYNAQVNSPNQDTVSNALKLMHTKYQDTLGVTGERVNAGGNETVNAGFTSKADMTAAINDPRYGKDHAYTKEIEQKVGKTPNSVFSGQ